MSTTWSQVPRTVPDMDETVAAIAARQHGVFTRAQARSAGISGSAIAYRLDKGRWIAVTKRVYRMGGSPQTARSVVMATVLSAGPGAIASAGTALAMHGIRDFAMLPAFVVVGRRPHRLAMPGVSQTFLLPESHRTLVDGLPVATPARALFDLAGTIGARRLARAVDATLAGRKVTVAQIQAVLGDLAERGRCGTASLRSVVAERLDSYVAPTTELEARFLELMSDHGFPTPERQVNLGGPLGWIGAVDFAWSDARLVVETDGSAFHDSITDREHDEHRDRALETSGWTVLRFSWIDVTRRPTSVIRTIRRALSLAA